MLPQGVVFDSPLLLESYRITQCAVGIDFFVAVAAAVVVVVVYRTLTDPLRIQPCHKIDGTDPNQTGNTFGDEQGKQTEENGQESSQQRTSSR